MAKTEPLGGASRPFAVWLVLLAAAGAFALTMGVRQTMGLFLSALNTSTGLGVGSISLAFALGQLCWGLTQPFAGAVADRIGTGRVILLGVVLVAVGTFITPPMTTTAGLILAIGVLAPKTGPVVLIFAAVMGVTFLSTVPATVGLVAKMFGTANMAMLFGIVMLAHQVGGFFGAYLGGQVFQATGSYDLVWYLDIVLAMGAALVNLPIREARLGRQMSAAT